MLLCGIIDELQKATAARTACVSYFFCQATDSHINSATAVLRALLYLLVSQQPALISHVRKKHDHAGKSMFEDANTWVTLTEIFIDVLRDPSLSPAHLLIDALDKCVTDLRQSDTVSSATYKQDVQDEGAVHAFLRESYLHWLEALSLCRSMAKGVLCMDDLQSLVKASTRGEQCV